MTTERENAQYIKMTETPVARLVVALGIPTTISMLVTSIYNMADTAFVGTSVNWITAAGSSSSSRTGLSVGIMVSVGIVVGTAVGNSGWTAAVCAIACSIWLLSY